MQALNNCTQAITDTFRQLLNFKVEMCYLKILYLTFRCKFTWAPFWTAVNAPKTHWHPTAPTTFGGGLGSIWPHFFTRMSWATLKDRLLIWCPLPTHFLLVHSPLSVRLGRGTLWVRLPEDTSSPCWPCVRSRGGIEGSLGGWVGPGFSCSTAAGYPAVYQRPWASCSASLHLHIACQRDDFFFFGKPGS